MQVIPGAEHGAVAVPNWNPHGGTGIGPEPGHRGVPVINPRCSVPVSPHKCNALCWIKAVSCIKLSSPANTRQGGRGNCFNSNAILARSRSVGAPERMILLSGQRACNPAMSSSSCVIFSSLRSSVVNGLR